MYCIIPRYSFIFIFVLKYLTTTIKHEGLHGLELVAEALEMDWHDVEAKIIRFIKSYVSKTEAKGVVLGLSGGVDSSTVAALSAKALGGNNVLGLMLPEAETFNPEDLKHAKLVAEKFKLEIETCDITPTLEALYSSIPIFDQEEKLCKGNLKARVRMVYWYYFANKLGKIVCGSSDKSETMMGYFTKWGDHAADIHPIMDLYKTQVRKLAYHVGIPKEIIEKPATPALWPGQTAEAELGIKYETLDLVLFALERFMAPTEIAKQLKIKKSLVEKIKQRWLSMEHKRRLLLTVKLGYRTVGTDFRLRRG
ncbi:MAG: NAD+ synthase [Candidatus Bathyarchaeia archaeon]